MFESNINGGGGTISNVKISRGGCMPLEEVPKWFYNGFHLSPLKNWYEV